MYLFLNQYNEPKKSKKPVKSREILQAKTNMEIQWLFIHLFQALACAKSLQYFTKHLPKDELCRCVYLYFHFLMKANRSSEMLHNNISFVYLWSNKNKQRYMQKLSASGSRFQPKECRCCYEPRFIGGRWSVQTNTWLSEPQGSKVRRKYRGVGREDRGDLSSSFRCLGLLSVMNEREMIQLESFKCRYWSWTGRRSVG